MAKMSPTAVRTDICQPPVTKELTNVMFILQDHISLVPRGYAGRLADSELQ